MYGCCVSLRLFEYGVEHWLLFCLANSEQADDDNVAIAGENNYDISHSQK